jgi:hypothetical protein
MHTHMWDPMQQAVKQRLAFVLLCTLTCAHGLTSLLQTVAGMYAGQADEHGHTTSFP